MNPDVKEYCLSPGGLKYYEKPDGFHLGTDTVLLTGFATLKKGETVTELCCGNGAGMLLLYEREPEITCQGLEIDRDAVHLCQSAFEVNGLPEGRMRVLCGDIRNRNDLAGLSPSHLVLANPPYHKKAQPGERQPGARSERTCTLENVVSAASALLKPKGRFAFALPPDRLQEAACLLEAHGLALKRMQTVFRKNGRCRLMLLEAQKGGKTGGLTLFTEEIYE